MKHVTSIAASTARSLLPCGGGLGWGVAICACACDDPPPCPSPTRGEGTLEALSRSTRRSDAGKRHNENASTTRSIHPQKRNGRAEPGHPVVSQCRGGDYRRPRLKPPPPPPPPPLNDRNEVEAALRWNDCTGALNRCCVW